MAPEPSPSPTPDEPADESVAAVGSSEPAEPFDPRPYLQKIGGDPHYLKKEGRVAWFRHDHPNGSLSTKLQEHVEGGYAVFSAYVSKGEGLGDASGWGSETKDDFKDYLEKAESKAISRALAHLGYGEAEVDGVVPAGNQSSAPQAEVLTGDARRRQIEEQQRQRSGGSVTQRQSPESVQGRVPYADGLPVQRDASPAAAEAVPPPTVEERIERQVENHARAAAPQGQDGLGGSVKPGDKPMLPAQWKQIEQYVQQEGLAASDELVQDAVIRIYNTTADFLTQSQAADFIHRLKASVPATLEDGQAPEKFPMLTHQMAELLLMRLKACQSPEEAQDWLTHIKTRFAKRSDRAMPFLQEMAEYAESEFGLTKAPKAA